jgi:hypothetical protein
MGKVDLKPIKRLVMQFTIRGTSPLITHQWSEKAKREMREKQAGKKTKNRDARNPDAEVESAAYRTANGEFGIPGLALKAAIIGAAHKDLGIERTLVRKALFLVTNDPNKIIQLDALPPTKREDMVRVGMGTDLRYRPQWDEWAVTVEFEVDGDLLTPDDVATLVDRAGFGVGIGEWRPEKGGEFGRFEIDRTAPFVVEEKQ